MFPLSDSEASEELRRLTRLFNLDILDTPPEAEYEHATALAQQLLATPISLVSLLDRDRQWFKSEFGLGERETAREVAFCNYTIKQDDVFIVEDAAVDERFSTNPLVTGFPFIRAYAGARLDMGDGLYAGSLCVIDRKPRAFSTTDCISLKRLAALVSSLLQQRQKTKQIHQLSVTLEERNSHIRDQAARLERKKRLLDSASAIAKLGAWEIDCSSGELSWSDGMYALHEMEPGTPVSVTDFPQFYSHEDFERLTTLIEQAKRTNGSYVFESEMVTKRGAVKWVRVVCNTDVVDGVAIRRFGTKQDITVDKENIEKIRFLAETDMLTGLQNRGSLMRYLEANAHSPLTLLLLDLDGFKDINDVHGHGAGDHCLSQIAHRLSSITRHTPFLARLGGDEFAMVLRSEDQEAASTVADIALQLANKQVMWRNLCLQLSTSIGISVRAAAELATPEDLLRQADLALYKSKSLGKNCSTFYSGDLMQVSEQRAMTILALRLAIQCEKLELFYQAKVPLDGTSKTCFEALLRWRKSDGSAVSPDSFRAAIEDPQLSVEIGDFVLHEALEQATKWRDEGFEFGSIAINIGAGQFRDPALGDKLISAMASRHLAPSDIQIEVTEDVLLSKSFDNVVAICRQLREYGVGVAFDDFGTGFASLTHLLEFPITEIKIDRSFVAKLFVHEGTESVIKSIVELGRGLDMNVVAEGVETAEQLQFLKETGCHFAQGYYFHRPARASEINQSSLALRRRGNFRSSINQ